MQNETTFGLVFLGALVADLPGGLYYYGIQTIAVMYKYDIILSSWAHSKTNIEVELVSLLQVYFHDARTIVNQVANYLLCSIEQTISPLFSTPLQLLCEPLDQYLLRCRAEEDIFHTTRALVERPQYPAYPPVSAPDRFQWNKEGTCWHMYVQLLQSIVVDHSLPPDTRKRRLSLVPLLRYCKHVKVLVPKSMHRLVKYMMSNKDDTSECLANMIQDKKTIQFLKEVKAWFHNVEWSWQTYSWSSPRGQAIQYGCMRHYAHFKKRAEKYHRMDWNQGQEEDEDKFWKKRLSLYTELGTWPSSRKSPRRSTLLLTPGDKLSSLCMFVCKKRKQDSAC